MKIESSIDFVAQNKKVLFTGYKSTKPFQLQEEEQYLFGKRLNMYTARVFGDFAFNLTSHPHENSLKSLVSLVKEELSRRCGNGITIFSKPIYFAISAYRTSSKL